MIVRTSKQRKDKYDNITEAVTLLQNLPNCSQIAIHPMCSLPYRPMYPTAVAAAHPASNKDIVNCMMIHHHPLEKKNYNFYLTSISHESNELKWLVKKKKRTESHSTASVDFKLNKLSTHTRS